MATPYGYQFGAQQTSQQPGLAPGGSFQYQQTNVPGAVPGNFNAASAPPIGMANTTGGGFSGGQNPTYMAQPQQADMNTGYNVPRFVPQGGMMPQGGMPSPHPSPLPPQFTNPVPQAARAPSIGGSPVWGQQYPTQGSYFPPPSPRRSSAGQTFGLGQPLTPPLSPYQVPVGRMPMRSPSFIPPYEDVFDEADFLDELDEFDELEARAGFNVPLGQFSVPPVRRVRRATMAPRSPVQLMSPMVSFPPSASPTFLAAPPMVHRHSAPSMFSMLPTERPYSYPPQHFQPPHYPGLEQDLALLQSVGQTLDIRSPQTPQLIRVLCQKSPAEIDALQLYFSATTANRDLAESVKVMLDVSRAPGAIRYPFMGLILGPLLFDKWLLTNLPPVNSDDILIDIFIGRHVDDLRMLNLIYSQGDPTGTRSLMTTVTTLTTSPELQRALKICAQSTRPDSLQPVDKSLVDRDVVDLAALVESRKPEVSHLFDIILRRSDSHLAQLSLFYQLSRFAPLETAILQCPMLPKMAKKIAVHAIRTATDPVHRDVMLLRHAMEAEKYTTWGGGQEKLGIRMVRMHWYKEHFRDVKEGFTRVVGRDLASVMSAQQGLFRDMMMSLAIS